MKLKNTLLFLFLFITNLFFGQTWVSKASHPGAPRHHPITFSLNGFGYLLTGSTAANDTTKDFYKYDPVANTWSTLPEFPGTARSYSYGAASQDKAYLGFGLSSNGYLNDLWEYNPANGNWSQLASCPCSARIHPTFVIQDNKIYVGQGNNTSNLKDWWVYNITTNTWSQLTDLPGATRHHPFYFAVGGNVYTGFGHGNGIFKDFYRWNVNSNTWTQLTNFPSEARVAGTQFNIGDRGFILSGDGDDHSSMPTGEFWEYNYQSDTWNQLVPHPGISRWAPGSFVIGNNVYFTSGEIHTGATAGLKNDMWSFDITSLSNNEFNKPKISMYPNPSKDYIYFTNTYLYKTISIEIYDYLGKKIKKMNVKSSTLNLSELNSGIYLIIVLDNEEVLDKIKLVKN